MQSDRNHRILIVDDNPAIHDDFRKILASGDAGDPAEDDILDAFLGLDGDTAGDSSSASTRRTYELTSAHQGEEAYELVKKSIHERRPFAMAFVDVRMPPGWDGIQTLKKIFEADPEIQAVVCTAYSDYSYDEMMAELGASERLLILKKPFDPIEVQQLANALVEKWQLAASNRERLEEVRAYAASLETVNRALASDKAMVEEFSRSRTDFIVEAGRALGNPAEQIADGLLEALDATESSELAGLLAPKAQGLVELLQQVVSLAELEGGRRSPARGECSLEQAINGAVENATRFGSSKGCAVRLELGPDLPSNVTVDAELLTELLTNLLNGALDVCPGSGIDVKLAHESDPGKGYSPLRITIDIDGLPLEPHEKASVFEPFWKKTGRLHLPLARQLARLQRFELFAEARRGESARLVLRMDLGAAKTEGKRAAA